MNTCQHIEPLLHLYREGELSDAERNEVLEHTKSCPACRGILGQLQSMDAAIAPLRDELPVLSDEAALVNETLDRIAGRRKNESAQWKRPSPLDEILRWLQPAFGLAFVAAIALFVIQQSRDAIKIAELENRLLIDGNHAMMGESLTNDIARKILELSAAGRGGGGSLKPSLNGTSILTDPARLLGLLQKNSGLFDELSHKYPELASVKVDNGINEHDRKVLDTEGRAFLKDFERLLKEGKKQP